MLDKWSHSALGNDGSPSFFFLQAGKPMRRIILNLGKGPTTANAAQVACSLAATLASMPQGLMQAVEKTSDLIAFFSTFSQGLCCIFPVHIFVPLVSQGLIYNFVPTNVLMELPGPLGPYSFKKHIYTNIVFYVSHMIV
jgi:hypothetical protein